ncbi:MAG: hypothetical protein VYD87_10950 [Pseudomonadota bacterium]|nr:hypothetical protein [Pseudomonadota bacterium]MEE3101983.1 hypothetical protein [Pseudomonadota bacterium]
MPRLIATQQDLDVAIRAVEVFGEPALPILRRVKRELDRQEEDRRLLDLVRSRSAGGTDK